MSSGFVMMWFSQLFIDAASNTSLDLQRSKFAVHVTALLISLSLSILSIETFKYLDIRMMTDWVGLALKMQPIQTAGKIAIGPAGIIPHFNGDKTFIDLLGKNDHHIARLSAKEGFLRGHNKFDFDYSLGKLEAEYAIIQLESCDDFKPNNRETEWLTRELIRSEIFLKHFNYAPCQMDITASFGRMHLIRKTSE